LLKKVGGRRLTDSGNVWAMSTIDRQARAVQRDWVKPGKKPQND